MESIVSHKIAIIGTGFVGSTTAFALALSGIVPEIALIDLNARKAEGEAMDINHGMAFIPPASVYNGDYSSCSGAEIIIITAGANQKPGETRLDLVKKNTAIFKEMVPQLVKYNDKAIYLIVTNPVDILTYVTLKVSGLPSNQVIGSGTVLDSSRFRFFLGKLCGIDPRNVHAYIIGEHGDSEVAAWSLTNIAGTPFTEYCDRCDKGCDQAEKQAIVDDVRNAAYKIIERKNATYYAVALAVRRIVECILRDENSVLTVSSLMKGQYGIDNICLSLPSIVGKTGIKKVLEMSLKEEEIASLKKSAETLKEVASTLEL
ncbi:L-lactate dehydrogenase [Calorimonas adulescens]|uniref:L-lactate dehydrogenase n=1 Tax=Calorimonas adulescens TaxID=2606906 RepID=A0A5D8QFF3_9THEO|nr:L-lactate dehydrogenase [Calorimonas adulescens]TZE82929.1 L-lactate dehydrogenase [Calorimonas adulescens]